MERKAITAQPRQVVTVARAVDHRSSSVMRSKYRDPSAQINSFTLTSFRGLVSGKTT
jgi:hypothetical protein